MRSNNNQRDLFMLDYAIGDRVQLHPATDRWMRGDRFGTVVAVGHRYVHVKLDASGDTKQFVPENLCGKVK